MFTYHFGNASYYFTKNFNTIYKIHSHKQKNLQEYHMLCLSCSCICRCWAPIVQYVDTQFQLFLQSETRVNRIGETSTMTRQGNSPFSGQAQDDRRVHALLYFISPTGHGLRLVSESMCHSDSFFSLNRPLDIEVMLAMHHKVNIIPVIAKVNIS